MSCMLSTEKAAVDMDMHVKYSISFPRKYMIIISLKSLMYVPSLLCMRSSVLGVSLVVPDGWQPQSHT